MTNEELREGLIDTIAWYGYSDGQARELADAALAFIQQHNDFARRVREVLESGLADTGYEYDWAISSINKAIALCDEELRNG